MAAFIFIAVAAFIIPNYSAAAGGGGAAAAAVAAANILPGLLYRYVHGDGDGGCGGRHQLRVLVALPLPLLPPLVLLLELPTVSTAVPVCIGAGAGGRAPPPTPDPAEWWQPDGAACTLSPSSTLSLQLIGSFSPPPYQETSTTKSIQPRVASASSIQSQLKDSTPTKANLARGIRGFRGHLRHYHCCAFGESWQTFPG